MKPFLVLQARPETEAADNEFQAFLDKTQLTAAEVCRIRLDQERLPQGFSLDDYAGVIVGGGPGCVSDAGSDKNPLEARIEADLLALLEEIIARDFPFMGCCLGIGILGHGLGGVVNKERYGESVGPVEISLTEAGKNDRLLVDFPAQFTALSGHKEALQELPKDCQHLLSSSPCPFQMIRYKNNIYATQFHPEADGAGFELRINIYRNRGYFHPDEADELISRCHAANVHVPMRILRNFVNHYGCAT